MVPVIEFILWSSIEILLLLIGGDKRARKRDVMLAIDYWKDHQADKPMSKRSENSGTVSHAMK